MGVLRLEPARLGTWAARSATAAWHLFDVQLAVYALLLAVVGVLMAYTNSTGSDAVAVGSTFARGLTGSRSGIVAFAVTSAIDYRCCGLRDPALRRQPRLLVCRWSRHGIGARRAGSRSAAPFQFSEIANILTIVAVANLVTSRHDGSPALDDRDGRRDRASGARPGAGAAGPRHVTRLRCDPRRDAVHLGLPAALARRVGRSVLAALPSSGRASSGTTSGSAACVLDPAADPEGCGYQPSSRRSPSGRAGLREGLTNGIQGHLDFLPVQSTDLGCGLSLGGIGLRGASCLGLFFRSWAGDRGGGVPGPLRLAFAAASPR